MSERRDKPILFSAPMIRALLDGRKTQTRRVLNPQPFYNGYHFDGNDILCHCDELPPSELLRRIGKGRNAYTGSILEDGPEWLTGMYVGYRLWVREAWSHTGNGVWSIADARLSGRSGVIYRADDDRPGCGWFPSIHMPREFSRLTLIVTDVRVQRLQEISEEDAIAEGVPLIGRGNSLTAIYEGADGKATISARDGFQRLWRTINGPGAWESNPWVAAYTFTVHKANIDALDLASAEPAG